MIRLLALVVLAGCSHLGTGAPAPVVVQVDTGEPVDTGTSE
jgi:hypothetical protein